MIEVKTFKDQKGKTVKIGDRIGYHSPKDDQLVFEGTVRRITKAGYFIGVFIEGRRDHPYYPNFIRLMPKESV